jgi:hypothetical protein
LFPTCVVIEITHIEWETPWFKFKKKLALTVRRSVHLIKQGFTYSSDDCIFVTYTFSMQLDNEAS